MALNKEKVKKILVVSLSNLGDIILTFPVIDILRRDFDQADLSVVAQNMTHLYRPVAAEKGLDPAVFEKIYTVLVESNIKHELELLKSKKP